MLARKIHRKRSGTFAFYPLTLRPESPPVNAPPPLICAALSDIGRVRTRNEDCVFAEAALGLFAVADGLGGRQAGDIASRIAIETLVASFSEERRAHALELHHAPITTRLVTAIDHANARVFRESCLDRRLAGMGTTLVAASLCATPQGETVLTVAHVGDSRLYRFHPANPSAAAELRSLTRDHSALQSLIDQGSYSAEEARRRLPRNYLTRALGVEPAVAIDHSSWTLLPGEIILLCSDGLTNMLDDTAIAACFADPDLLRDLDALAVLLIDSANARGGHDNISVILAALA